MANWYGTARSNYVQIKDIEGLQRALLPFEIRMETSDGLTCFLSEERDSGGWPSWASDEENTEFDPAIHICPFMSEGQVLVMMEAGAEKLRYVTGVATAYNCKGKRVTVDLTDIYAKAAKRFKVPLFDVTRAEY